MDIVSCFMTFIEVCPFATKFRNSIDNTIRYTLLLVCIILTSIPQNKRWLTSDKTIFLDKHIFSSQVTSGSDVATQRINT